MHLLCAVGIVLAGLLVVAGTATADSVDRPALTAGDWWTYRTNSTLPSGFVLEGQFTSTVLAVSPSQNTTLAVSGSGTASGHVSTPSGDGIVAGQWTLTGEDVLEPLGFEVVYSVVDLTVNGTYQGLISFRFHLVNTTAFTLVQDGWRFPYMTGGSGGVSMVLNYSQDAFLDTQGYSNSTHANGTAPGSFVYSMKSGTTMVAPAGTFGAYPIHRLWPDGSLDVAYFAPDVGNDVATQSYNATGVLVGSSLLLAYRYQALEPRTYLGLTLLQWGIVAGVGAAVTATAAVMLHRRRKKRGPVPPSMLEPDRP